MLTGSNKKEYQKDYMKHKREREVLEKFLKDNNIGTESGQHPFYSMPSVIFTPNKKLR